MTSSINAIFAIDGVRGDYDGLSDMLMLVSKNKYFNANTSRLVFLSALAGGTLSSLCIDTIRKLNIKHQNAIVPLANKHDLRITKLPSSLIKSKEFFEFLHSYKDDDAQTIDRSMLLSHLKWLNTLPFYYKSDKFIFVSGGVDPYKSVLEQPVGSFTSPPLSYTDCLLPKPIESDGYRIISSNPSIDSVTCTILDDTNGIILDTLENSEYNIN